MSRGVYCGDPSLAALPATGACWMTVVVVLLFEPTPSASSRTATRPPPTRPLIRGSRSCLMTGRSIPAISEADLNWCFVPAEGRAQLAEAHLGIGRAHQQLPDQHGVDADALELLDLLAAVDPRLADHGLPGRHVGEQLEGAVQVDAEVGEVAVVDADDLGLDVQRALELVLVVDLDEHVEVDPPRLLVQRAQVG